MTTMRRLLMIFSTALIFALSACDEGDASQSEGPIPDTVSENLRLVTVSATGRVEIDAEGMETYNEDDYSVLLGARMAEIDGAGVSKTEGGADRIELHGNGDGSASGSIVVHDLMEESRLRASELVWKDDERQLTAKGGVSVELSDGLTVRGEQLQADVAQKTYIFTDGVEGSLELDGD